MSIFSRLFNKGQAQEGEGRQDPRTTPEPQAEPPRERPPDRARSSEPDPSVGLGDDEEADYEATRQVERPDLVAASSRAAALLQQSMGIPPSEPPPAGSEPPVEDTSTQPLPPHAKRPGPVPGAAALASLFGPPPASPAATTHAEGDRISQQPLPAPRTSLSRGRPPAPAALGKLFETPAPAAPRAQPGTEIRVERGESSPDRASRADIDPRAAFLDLSANYMLPVRDFMFDVKSGEARVDWLHTCEASVRSMQQAAKSLGLEDIARALSRYGEVLVAAARTGEARLQGPIRDQLLSAYFPLVDLLPQAFGLDDERVRRETLVLTSLLLQVPGAGNSAVELLHGAGMSSLGALLGVSAEEISTVTGLRIDVARAIQEKVAAHRHDFGALSGVSPHGMPAPQAPVGAGAPPMPGTTGTSTGTDDGLGSIDIVLEPASVPPAQEAPPPAPVQVRTEAHLLPFADYAALSGMLVELRKQHDAYEKAKDGWTEAAAEARRVARRARGEVLAKVRELLLRVGEREGANEIERVGFDRKIERIEKYLRNNT